MSKIILSKKDWRECDGCSEKIKPVFWNRVWDDETNGMIDAEETELDTDFMLPNTLLKQLDGGVSFELIGSYDEFFDCMSEKDIIKINACHDCTAKLFALFPNKTKNCLGKPTRDSGQSLDPDPPHKTTGVTSIGVELPIRLILTAVMHHVLFAFD
jgi:hypothetical protein